MAVNVARSPLLRGRYTARLLPRKLRASASLPARFQSTAANVTAKRGGVLSIVALLLTSTGVGFWAGSNIQTNNEEFQSTRPLEDARPVLYRGTRRDVQAAWEELSAIVGEENLSDLEGDLEGHSTSSWSTHKWDPVDKPYCVIYPATTDEVSRIMKVCHARRLPVTGYSGGTSLEGHYTPTHGGITIDVSRMNKILAVHQGDLDVVVQPAVGWQELNQSLAEKNLFFPPDPGPGAKIGGMVGTGCSGTNAYRYGTMRDWVVNLTVVLADGTVIKTRRRPRKSSAGYNLTHLFVGSEGTLGIVTEATLKLTPLPESTSVAVCAFKSVRDAADCVAEVVGRGIQLGAIEILDDNQMRFLNDASGASARKWSESPTLFLKFSGTVDAVKNQILTVKDIASRTGSLTFDFAKSEAEKTELWSARKDAFWAALSAMGENESVWTGDVAVPMSSFPAAIDHAKEQMKLLGLRGSIVGHSGDGNFHTIVFYSDASRKSAEEFVKRMVDNALDLEGTCTGEHGIGLVKRECLVKELGEETIAAMRKLKEAFDPLCLLNCDKIFLSRKEEDS